MAISLAPESESHSAPEPEGGRAALAALKDSASVGLGFLPLGLAFGALVVQSGLAWWCAVLFAGLIYAGSFEFLLIGLVVTAAPLATVGLTAFLVNIRHVFYTLSFPLDRIRGTLGRAYGTFALSDEAFALATARGARSWSGRRILWTQGYLHLYWVTGATLGALLGSVVPAGLHGLDFALTALFAVLAVDAIRDSAGDKVTPGLALASALVAKVLFPGELLLTAFVLFTTALMARRLLTARKERRA
ncbi:AzlC family ABC transporter permease [Streptomyces sp. NPDC004539]|uniref:AzlC family ABC transporter permease n=1 Tax=Streptomyces sp. NPDC004539 TaxID=3154280 RepID=UPI0033A94716